MFDGYKTYIVCAAAILTAVAAYLNKSIDLTTMITIDMRGAKSLIVILAVALLCMTALNIYWYRKYHEIEQRIVDLSRFE